MAAPGHASPGPGQGKGQEEWKDYQTVFTNSKAGMEGVDKEKVIHMTHAVT